MNMSVELTKKWLFVKDSFAYCVHSAIVYTHMKFEFVTIFPELYESFFGHSILQRAIEAGHIEVAFHNPRDFTTDKHRMVDDTPYGGGPGMVMKVEPIALALKSIKREKRCLTVLMSAKGQRFTQQKAQSLAAEYDQIIFVCGRYEGVDERVLNYIDEEISIGDYVLTGGEQSSMIVTDAVARLVPGVLGDLASTEEESHSKPGYIEYPHYTRPAEYDGHSVPDVLLSGDHGAIEQWRKEQSGRSEHKGA